MLYTLLKFLGLHNLKVIMNGNSGFKIETYFTLIARDLLTSLASQRSMKCVQFVLLHINPFSGMPGNVPGLSLLPILLYPGNFPCCDQCSIRSRSKYFRTRIIHVEVVHMLAEQ